MRAEGGRSFDRNEGMRPMKTKDPTVVQPPPEVATSLISSVIRRSAYATRTETGEATTPGFLTLAHINANTPMGATVRPEGATFRVWAPAAQEMRLRWGYAKSLPGGWAHNDEAKLQQTGEGYWAGFVPDLRAGERYLFYVVGPDGGTTGPKRDPYARELTQDPMWPDCQCVLVDPAAFPWHDQGYRPPAFHELVIYQLHVGVWYSPVGRSHGTFLDVVGKLPYLATLGINAIQPLPVVEFPTLFSLGYNGVDYYSPETDYAVKDDDPALSDYLGAANLALLAVRPNARTYSLADVQGTANQFKVMVDLCHVYGIAVLLDVVYNHAGGAFGDQSIYFFDRRHQGNDNDSLYFTDRGWAGGLVFAYWNDTVKQFLIDNAKYYLTENHCDGFRYDEVSVIKNVGGAHGWLFCQYVTDTAHYVKPEAIHIAESWPVEQAIVARTGAGGAGFDATQNDGLREAVRSAISQAAQGAGTFVDLDGVGREIASPVLSESWRAVQCTENHDIVRTGRAPRMPALADGSNARSWYARSRSRVALGLTLTAAGIPHLFMGQEFLELKPWSDDPAAPNRIDWAGAENDRAMADFLRFSRELIATRRSLPGLRGAGLNVFHVHNLNRVLAFHRWTPGEDNDVVVIVSLAEATFRGYQLGFPGGGTWREVFNSDYYDNCPNPLVAGNGGRIDASGGPMHGLPASAILTLPANAILIFTR
jgi:1,4-alpha-glucan branching enzyme